MGKLKVISSEASVSYWWYASALATGWAFYWVFHIQFLQWSFMVPHDQGVGPLLRGFRVTNSIMAGVLILLLPAMGGMKVDRSVSRLRQGTVVLVLLVFAGIQFQTWREYRRSAELLVEDVGKTSILADQMLARGVNPYVAEVDPQEKLTGSKRFNGYKYLPVTLVAYSISAVLGGDASQGVVATNLVLSLLTALALVWVVKKAISLDAGLVCATLFFMSEIVTYELVVLGSNDIIPMLLVVLALGFIENRLVCGVLVGLAISAKFLPGMMWIPVLLMPQKNRRFAIGVLGGLLPCLPFFVWGPRGMIDNVVIYVLGKAWYPSALLYSQPAIVRAMAHGFVAAIAVAMGIYAARNQLDLIRRCAMAAVLALAFELAALTVHQNYFVWWHVPLCVVAAGFIFNPGAYGWMGRRARID